MNKWIQKCTTCLLAVFLTTSLLPKALWAEEVEEIEEVQETKPVELEQEEDEEIAEGVETVEPDVEEIVEETPNEDIDEELEQEDEAVFVDGTPYYVQDNVLSYDVNVEHVLINQAYTSAKGAYASNGFIELYNPTSRNINLAGWSIQYKSSMDGGSMSWAKHDLSGVIPAKSSYLICCASVNGPDENAIQINEYDEYWEQSIYNKGFSLVLVANTDIIPNDSAVYSSTRHKPVIEGYVDGYGVSGNDGLEEQRAPIYETSTSSVQSKKKTIRRYQFRDQDNNSINGDFQVMDYSFPAQAYRDWMHPRWSGDGQWVASYMPEYTVTFNTNGGTTIASKKISYTQPIAEPEQPVKEGFMFTGWYSDAECTIEYDFSTLPLEDVKLYAGWTDNLNTEWIQKIEDLKETIPPYYTKYYQTKTVTALKDVLDRIKAADLNSIPLDEIKGLCDELEKAIAGLVYIRIIVPQVYITTNDSVGNSLTKADGYVSTKLAIAFTSGKVIEDTTGEIKVRGNSTADGEKKPYNIKFSSKQDIGGMGASKKWCLLANCFDPTLLRNYMALELAREMGIQYTSEQEYCEVWIDGVFKGCYVLTEAVEASSTRVDINKGAGEFLYEEETSRVEEGVTYITSKNGLRFAMKDPEVLDGEQFEIVLAKIDGFVDAIQSNDYTKVEAYADMESFAKLYLLNEYMKTLDVGYSSVYFYYKNGKMYAGPAWDFDLSSGNCAETNPYYFDSDGISYTNLYANKTWFKYLFKYKEFRQLITRLFDTYSPYLQSMYANGGIIDSLLEKYQAPFSRNWDKAKWVVSKRYASYMRNPDATYEQNIQYYRNWLSNRYAWLDAYYHSQVSLESQSSDLILNIGDNADFEVVAKGSYLTYKWYYQYYGQEKWNYWASLNSSSIHLQTNPNWNGMKIYCEVEDFNGNSVKSEVINVYLNTPFFISKQPQNTLVAEGEKPDVSVETSQSFVTYQWYYKKLSDSKFNLWTGETSKNITAVANSSWNGMKAYCVITDMQGMTLTTNTIEFTIAPPLYILRQPKDTLVEIGTCPELSIAVKGKELSYQWYIKKATATKFSAWFGQTKEKVNAVANDSWEGMQVYCIVQDASGNSEKSDIITLHIGIPIRIIKQPVDCVVSLEKVPSVSVEAVGNGLNLSYQWYVKKADNTSFYKWEGQNTKKVTAPSNSSWEGMEAYCKITDQFGNYVLTDVIHFYIGTAIEILKQPANITVKEGTVPSLSIEATGEHIQYQWYIKKTSATKFSQWIGQTNPKVNATCNNSWEGMQAYCQVTDSNGRHINTDTITIHVGDAISILKQPEDGSVSVGQVPMISVIANGSNLTYQWYIKKTSSSKFSPWIGQNRAQIFVSANESWQGMKTYCMITDALGHTLITDTITISIE